MNKTLEFTWTTSKARDTYGYNIVTLYVDGKKVSSCNGGGYDMKGTVLGNYIAETFPDRLLKLTKEFYGLTFHDPNFDPGKIVIDGETINEREKAGKTVGLDRYQAFYSASSKLPTKNHTVPLLNGACGFSSMENVIKAIGMQLRYIPVRSQNLNIYQLTDEGCL